jgi:hypothetical protein
MVDFKRLAEVALNKLTLFGAAPPQRRLDLLRFSGSDALCLLSANVALLELSVDLGAVTERGKDAGTLLPEWSGVMRKWNRWDSGPRGDFSNPRLLMSAWKRRFGCCYFANGKARWALTHVSRCPSADLQR